MVALYDTLGDTRKAGMVMLGDRCLVFRDPLSWHVDA